MSCDIRGTRPFMAMPVERRECMNCRPLLGHPLRIWSCACTSEVWDGSDVCLDNCKKRAILDGHHGGAQQAVSAEKQR